MRRSTIAGILLAVWLAAPSLALGHVSTFHHVAQGANFLGFTCQGETAPFSCDYVEIFVLVTEDPEPGMALGRLAFHALVYHEELLVLADGTLIILEAETGVTPEAMVTYDKTHLSSATAVAEVPMPDGSQFAFDLTWTAVTDVMKFGNDGPLSEFFDLPARHYVDDCLTANFNDHQRFRFAAVDGVIDGTSTESWTTIEAGVIRNWFHWIEATHGKCL